MTTQKSSTWPLPSASPEEVGFSAERLARIGPRLQKFIDQEKVPNLVTLVARHGKIVHFESRGYMDFASRQPASRDTVYRLWSNTKPITGVATMICVEDGLLNLDDPVAKYIPAFENQVVRLTELPRTEKRPMSMMTPTVPVDRPITIRDCLRNTTGLTTPRSAPIQYMTEFKDVYSRDKWFADHEKPSKIRETVEALAKLPLDFQPGTSFVYQVGYTVIGVVLEQATGRTLEDFYQERIFRPLGMKDTSFYLPANCQGRFPTCYRPVQQGGRWRLAEADIPKTSEKVTGPRTFFEAGGGAGGVLSTASDYARFAQMLLNGGELEGVRILGRKTVKLMTSSHTGGVFIPITGPGFGFGMGVGVYKGSEPPLLRSVGTFGWSGLAGTMFFADPVEDLFALIFTQVLTHQVMPDNTYQEEFEQLVYEALD